MFFERTWFMRDDVAFGDWFESLKKLNLEFKSKLAKDPPKEIPPAQATELNAIVIDCIKEFNTLGKDQEVEQWIMHLKEHDETLYEAALNAIGREVK